jgi:hypothetical protein
VKRPETNLERLDAASALLRKVSVSFTERRPKGWSGWQADAALQQIREATARIGNIADKLRAGESRREAAS